MLMLFYYDLFIYVFFFGVVPQLGARDSDCIGARGSLVSLTELPRIWNRRILCSMMTEYQRSWCKTSEFAPFFQPFLKLSTVGKGVFGALKPVKKLGERAFASLLDLTVVFFARFPTRFSLEISHRSVAWVCLRIGPTPDCHGWSALSQIKMHFASIILGVLWGILHSGAKPHGRDLACGFHYIVMMILIITIDSRICTLNVSRPQTTSPKIVSMWASQIWLNHIKWSFFGTWGRTKSVK